jgi:hypothetical protein
MGNVAARAPSTSRNTLHGPAHTRTASPIHGLRTIHKPRIRQDARPKSDIRSTAYSFSRTYIKPCIHSAARTSKRNRRSRTGKKNRCRHPAAPQPVVAPASRQPKPMNLLPPVTSARRSLLPAAPERLRSRTNPRRQETRTDTPPTLTGRWSTRQWPEFSCSAAAASICERA